MKLKKLIVLSNLWLLLPPLFGVCQTNYKQEEIYKTQILENEYWWGGLSVDGIKMPYSDTTSLERNLYGNTAGNQGAAVVNFK